MPSAALPLLALPTQEAVDTAAIPPLPTSDVFWRALKAINAATIPLAPQEQREVAAGLDRRRRGMPAGDVVTQYHCSRLPGIPFPEYAVRAAQSAGYGCEGIAVGLALLARYAVATKRGVTPLSMHRLFATCMQLGMKATSDRFLKNHSAAKVFGMAVTELNAMERALVRDLDFWLVPSLAELVDLPHALAAAAKAANDDHQGSTASSGGGGGGWDHTQLHAVLAQTCDHPATPARSAASERRARKPSDSASSYASLLSPKSSGSTTS